MKPYLANFKKYLGLTLYLARTTVELRYKKSYLGLFWSLLNPLLTMLVLTMVFSKIFHNQIENYPVYLMCGRLLFEFNAEATKAAMNSIVANAGLIKKVYVPKYVFPLAGVLASMVNMLFSFLALLLVMLAMGAAVHWTMLLSWLPVAYILVFSTGLGLLLAAANVFFRDIRHLYGVFLTLWMYLTPVFYPVGAVPGGVGRIIGLNPLYHFISMFRDVVMYGKLPGMAENAWCLAASLSFLALGLVSFKKVQDKFILYI